MKKIIDGKVYDTATATEVCDISGQYGSDPGDFRYDDTRLYRSPKGQFFIAGKGGASSRWATPVGSARGAGSGLHLVDVAEARRLFEQHGGADYAEFFGEPEEG